VPYREKREQNPQEASVLIAGWWKLIFAVRVPWLLILHLTLAWVPEPWFWISTGPSVSKRAAHQAPGRYVHLATGRRDCMFTCA
jgi:hypothetical protein